MFLYTCQNQNRGVGTSTDSDSEPRKKSKEATKRHLYPIIPVNSDDQESTQRHLKKLKLEMEKVKPSMEIVKELMARTFAVRREWLLQTDTLSVAQIIDEYPAIKKTVIVSFSVPYNVTDYST